MTATHRSTEVCLNDVFSSPESFGNRIKMAFNGVMEAAFGFIPDTTGFGAVPRRSIHPLDQYLFEATRDLNPIVARNNPKLPKFEIFWETGPGRVSGCFVVRVEQPEEISA